MRKFTIAISLLLLAALGTLAYAIPLLIASLLGGDEARTVAAMWAGLWVCHIGWHLPAAIRKTIP